MSTPHQVTLGNATGSDDVVGRATGSLPWMSGLTSFLFIPYRPIRSLLIIALDVFVICALCSYDRDAARR